MHQIINAAYCIHYDDYDFLLDVVRSVREASTGVELAIYTDKPDFMAKQALQKARLADVPAGASTARLWIARLPPPPIARSAVIFWIAGSARLMCIRSLGRAPSCCVPPPYAEHPRGR